MLTPMLLAAEDKGPGGLGALVLVVFFAAAVVIFIAMSRSLKRMRSNVDRGAFPGADDGADPAARDRTAGQDRAVDEPGPDGPPAGPAGR